MQKAKVKFFDLSILDTMHNPNLIVLQFNSLMNHQWTIKAEPAADFHAFYKATRVDKYNIFFFLDLN